jgi:HlyD family secretion protein
MKTIYIIIAIFAAILSLIGCGNNNDGKTIEASGNIEATNVIVSSKVTGEIVSLNKDEGDLVKEGDTILVIDNELLTLQLNQAEAAVKGAEAQHELLKNGARQEDIKQAEEGLKQAEANYTVALKDRDRMQALFTGGTVTQKQLDDAVAKYDITNAQLKTSKENLHKVKNYARPEEIKQSQANLDKQEAGVKILQKNIRDSYVKSPVNGIIVKNFIEKGETVTQLSSLVKVSDLKKVELVIYVSEEELGKVKLGQRTDVKVDTYSNRTFHGKITFISPEAEFTPKNIQTKDERTKLVFAVKIEIDNPGMELKPGMPADAIVYLDK